MRVIVVTNQKGGVGKTTTAGHLAVAAEADGQGPVVLIDTDQQENLADWWNARQAETPAFVQATIEDLPTKLQALREAGVKLVIIDTPPRVGDQIEAAIREADLVVIPVKPGPHEMRAIGPTMDMIDEAGKRMVFVLCLAKAKAKLTALTHTALAAHGCVAPVLLHNREDFANAMLDGRVAQEYAPRNPAAQEATELWAYVAKQLRRKAKA